MKLSPIMLMLLTYAAGMTALALLDGEQPRPVVEAIKADYQNCVVVNPGPLRHEPHIDGDNRHRDIA